MRRDHALAIVGLLSAMPAFAQTLRTADRPTEPYVQHDVCPYECCQLGPWVARKPFKVYDAPRRGAAVLTSTRRGQAFRALTGEMHFSRVGRVVLGKPFELRADTGAAVMVPRGDTVIILSYEGEGFHDAWYRGTVYSVEEFWDEPGVRPRVPPAPGTMVRAPEGVWWIRVQLRDGRRGWIRGDEIDVDGSDACG